MFLLLSRVLLWLLIGAIVYSLFQRFYPTGNFVGRLVIVIVLVVIALAFVNPNEPAVASLWRLISFPLKPLGASVLLLMLASGRIKGGGIDKPGGYLLGWALTLLMLSSTPAIAYFLVRAPIAMIGDTQLANQEVVQNFQLASSLGVAAPTSAALVAGDSIVSQEDIGQVTLAFNSLEVKIPPYLLQNPQEIRTRGLRLEDFVPSAETLQLTTQVWESYLNQIYFFLRGRQ
ncbi:hypothetical protein [Calothrix sp. PCC 7507]|uniref:hypothetical protein n=1 Tax=Calothrix sp. PCC 7507 TaxID=99598 RepID=UPI00029F077F|nr:hypothetical protein [Calothrix sp. PCC 7507]AFY35314.1 hypothetical protein Cal7507_4963 [Calothrix sp. PCC 7507]